MKKIFLDTNFVVDLLLRDEFKETSQRLLALGATNGCKFYVSFLTVANFCYIARKLPKENLYAFVLQIDRLFNIVANDAEQIRRAVLLEPSDIEDALQYQAASDARCDVLITRNAKDFPFSKIEILSPMEFILRI